MSDVSPMDVFTAILSRRSVRAFRPDPVERATVEHILSLASRAPNGSNIQPWRVWVVAGETKRRLSKKILAAHETDDSAQVEEYQYYPREWTEPYLARRRQLGKELYAQLGIAKGDQPAMKAQFGRNYVFFDAPIGLFVTIEHSMEQGGWIDLGAFLQTFCLAARGHGLDTCPQQAFSKYHRLIRAELDIPEDQIIAFGIALGKVDPEAAINRLAVERDPVEVFARFRWE